MRRNFLSDIFRGTPSITELKSLLQHALPKWNSHPQISVFVPHNRTVLDNVMFLIQRMTSDAKQKVLPERSLISFFPDKSYCAADCRVSRGSTWHSVFSYRTEGQRFLRRKREDTILQITFLKKLSCFFLKMFIRIHDLKEKEKIFENSYLGSGDLGQWKSTYFSHQRLGFDSQHPQWFMILCKYSPRVLNLPFLDSRGTRTPMMHIHAGKQLCKKIICKSKKCHF